jgi:hypothetical protein
MGASTAGRDQWTGVVTAIVSDGLALVYSAGDVRRHRAR